MSIVDVELKENMTGKFMEWELAVLGRHLTTCQGEGGVLENGGILRTWMSVEKEKNIESQGSQENRIIKN